MATALEMAPWGIIRVQVSGNRVRFPEQGAGVSPGSWSAQAAFEPGSPWSRAGTRVHLAWVSEQGAPGHPIGEGLGSQGEARPIVWLHCFHAAAVRNLLRLGQVDLVDVGPGVMLYLMTADSGPISTVSMKVWKNSREPSSVSGWR